VQVAIDCIELGARLVPARPLGPRKKRSSIKKTKRTSEPARTYLPAVASLKAVETLEEEPSALDCWRSS
jgi:hypothetical protein